MSRAPRIPAAEWDRHKDHIHALYVTQDKTLEDVISCMTEEHGFKPTKAQYVRKLDGWKMRKNFKKEEWNHANALVRKRKSAGKDTELVMSGRVIQGEKRRKVLSRYAHPHTAVEPALTSLKASHNGVVARTPPSAVGPFIVYNNMPWFQFQDSIAKLARDNAPSDLLMSTRPDLAISLAKDVFGFPLNRDDRVERHNTYLSDIFEKVSPQPLIQVLQWVIYLSSNGLLSNEKMDDFLERVIKNDNQPFLEYTLQVKGPTVRAFLPKLILSAIRIGNASLVKILLNQEVSPNSVESNFTGHTALQTAIVAGNVAIVQLLLERGADANGTGAGPFKNVRPLNLIFSSRFRPSQLMGRLPEMLINADKRFHFSQAASLDHITLVKLLIEAGANVNECSGDLACPLWQAVNFNNIELVRLLIEAGADVNNIMMGQSCALQEATEQQNPRMVNLLLKAGADVNIPLSDKHKVIRTQSWRTFKISKDSTLLHALCTPLYIAASLEDEEMVRLILKANANVDGVWFSDVTVDENLDDVFDFVDLDAQGMGTRTPLHESARNGDVTMIKLLLDAGANPNVPSITGLTSLQSISSIHESWTYTSPGRLKMAQFLLRQGADVNAPPSRNWSGMTALQAAISSNDMSLVSLFLERGAHVNAASCRRGGRTALQASAENGSMDLVNMLIDMGGLINADAAEFNGLTCLQAAASSKNLALINMLLLLGANVNAPASEVGQTALQAAAESQHIHTVKRLLDVGADVNQIGDRDTALGIAIRNEDNYHYLSDFLLENGADPDPPMAKITPLAMAAKMGWARVVQLLLNAGANINRSSLNPYKTDDLSPGLAAPQTPLAIAVEYRQHAVVEVLITSGADLNYIGRHGGATPLCYAFSCFWFPHDITLSLIRGGADPNKPSTTGLCPIHLAVKNMSILYVEEAIKILIDAGADVNCQTPAGTALQMVVEKGYKHLVGMLLDAGADINAPAMSHKGMTPLQAAAKRDDLPLVQDLMSRGANANVPAAIQYGATALQFAAMNGNINMAILLLENGANINAEPSATGGRTALDGAAEHGRLDMIYLLLGNDKEMELIEKRCQKAAKFADANFHPIIAKILREWKRP
ncbi:hypothetical protein G7Z17_g636 [Cylindrodendrum hubeiense]|uniref:Clr5 domain-containing protein n=1 Tax=Cylindrodendrum hubeiense TaxID=595255 RepID=A0A9P5HRK8_9HYPO|nr:hypothetical protein G7Z17_g636 [Cylindrodendrum hubeiense]